MLNSLSWTEYLCLCRNLLCSLVRVKLSCYEMENQCSLSVEDYLKAFLENEVKPLWPKGWMQARSVSVCVCVFLFMRLRSTRYTDSFSVIRKLQKIIIICWYWSHGPSEAVMAYLLCCILHLTFLNNFWIRTKIKKKPKWCHSSTVAV